MPKRRVEPHDRMIELLEKALATHLYIAGASQTRIAGIVGKKTAWANALLKGLPRGGRENGR